MKRLKMVVISGLGLLISSTVLAQQQTANLTTTFNFSLTTAATIVANDNTNAAWMIHPANGGICCTFGTPSGGAAPTPVASGSLCTTGVELTSGGYFSSGVYTPAAAAVVCVSESGSAVSVNGTIEKR